MEAWPWEEPGLGDVRSATWSGCARGIQQTAGAFGSSLRKKTQKVGCPGCWLLGACSWVVLGVPG